MRKFLKTVLVYGLIVCIITESVNYAYLLVKPNSIKFQNVPYGITICNFGSSHSEHSFKYDNITDETCFNFALSAQFPSYDVRILKCYLDHFQEGATAYLTISYFSLFGTKEEERSNFKSKNRRYYSFLPKELVKEYDLKTNVFSRFLPSLTVDEDLFTTFWSAITKNDPNTLDLVHDHSAAEQDGKARYKNQIVHLLDDDGNRLYNYEEISAVYEWIQLCKDNQIEPILVTTPFLTEFSSVVRENDPEFLDDFYGLIAEIQEKTGVRYYDYSTDERFSLNYQLFGDTDHLTDEGGRLFTEILIRETLGE